MKRIICILSLLAMIVFLCACGGLNTNNDEGSQDTDHLAEQFEEVNLISVNEDEAQENGGLYIIQKSILSIAMWRMGGKLIQRKY